jgi:large subunit ribosomal protein L28
MNVSHSNRHTRRWFMPNIQKAKLVMDGKSRSVSICTRCLRTLQNKYATVG